MLVFPNFLNIFGQNQYGANPWKQTSLKVD